MKKTILSFLILFSFNLFLEAKQEIIPISVVTERQNYPSVNLLLIDKMGYLNLKDVKEIFHANVTWHQVSHKVVLSINNKKVELFYDEPKVIIDNVDRSMNKPTRVIDGEVWLPLELIITQAFQEVVGQKINWDYNQKTLSIGESYKNNDVYLPTPKITEKSSSEKQIIVLDAGHGGKDPGAIGPNGIQEKDIVLDIAFRLKKLLEENSEIEVFLTRDGDYFVPLSERTNFANSCNADLFISIHANASLSQNSCGFEVYFLSEKASDSLAQAVANRENSVISLENSDKFQEVNSILWSMEQTQYMNQSSELSSFVVSEIKKSKELINRGVKQAGFYVLKGAQMPAVLLEVAFISNPEEEKKLSQPTFRQEVAELIYQGLKNYNSYNGKENL